MTLKSANKIKVFNKEAFQSKFREWQQKNIEPNGSAKKTV